MRSRALRRRYGRSAARTPWAGTNHIDRRYFDIQPGLALTALSSGPLDAGDARMITKGREFLEWLVPQHAPRGVRAYKEAHVASIRRLIVKAEARR
jgi:hypothetical protein